MRRGALRLLSRLGVLLVSVAVALLVCELALRLVYSLGLLPDDNIWVRVVESARSPAAPEGERRLFRRSESSVLGWEPIPGFEHRHIRINSAGFRGPEIDRRPPPGVVRIAVLGDSETFGMLLPESHTLPGAVQEILSSSFDRRFEVLNFGVPGYNTVQELEVLKTKAIALDPDAVLLYYNLNDPEAWDLALLTGDLRRRSHLYLLYVAFRKSYSRMPGLHGLARNNVEYLHFLYAPEYFDRTRRAIEEMARYLAGRDIPFVVAISPEVFDVDDFREGYPYSDIHRRLHALASPEIHVIDPTPALASRFRDPKELWVTPTDPHKNHLANRAIGEVIARALADRLGLADG